MIWWQRFFSFHLQTKLWKFFDVEFEIDLINTNTFLIQTYPLLFYLYILCKLSHFSYLSIFSISKVNLNHIIKSMIKRSFLENTLQIILFWFDRILVFEHFHMKLKTDILKGLPEENVNLFVNTVFSISYRYSSVSYFIQWSLLASKIHIQHNG